MDDTNDDFDIISLTPDMSATWGSLLKKLREQGQQALYIAVTEQATPEFYAEEIVLATTNESVYEFLRKHQSKFDKIAGQGIVQITLGQKKGKQSERARKLKEMFSEIFSVE